MHDVCPTCGCEEVGSTREANAVRFECKSCDWCVVETNPFDLGAWSVRINQALAPLDILSSLMTAPEAAAFLKSRIKGVSYLSSFPVGSACAEASDEYLRGEMTIAHQVYLRQTIVLAATYIELILTDFFESLFHAQPLRMNQVLPPRDKSTATIGLEELVEASSKEDLLAALALRAAKIKASEQPDKTFKMLTTDCSLRLNRPLVQDLKAFRELRNQIVHDDREAEVTVEKVHDVFGLVLYALFVLAQVCEVCKVPYWDDVGFINDFEEKLREAPQQ